MKKKKKVPTNGKIMIIHLKWEIKNSSEMYLAFFLPSIQCK